MTTSSKLKVTRRYLVTRVNPYRDTHSIYGRSFLSEWDIAGALTNAGLESATVVVVEADNETMASLWEREAATRWQGVGYEKCLELAEAARESGAGFDVSFGLDGPARGKLVYDPDAETKRVGGSGRDCRVLDVPVKEVARVQVRARKS